MRCVIRSTALLSSLVALAACSSTGSRLTAFTDPDARHEPYRRVLVVAGIDDLAEREAAERQFAAALQSRGTDATPAITLFLPTRSYTEAEEEAALAAGGFDGILSATLEDAWTESAPAPRSGVSIGFGMGSGGYGRRGTFGGVGVSSGSAPSSEIGYRFRIELYDRELQHNAWVGTAKTKSQSSRDFESMIGSLAEETVAALAAEGFLAGVPGSAPE